MVRLGPPRVTDHRGDSDAGDGDGDGDGDDAIQFHWQVDLNFERTRMTRVPPPPPPGIRPLRLSASYYAHPPPYTPGGEVSCYRCTLRWT